MNLHEKVAIVTGAGGGGCGRVIARRLARDGCRVVASDLDEARARETVRQIEVEGGQAIGVRCDVAREADLRALFDAAAEKFGGVDIVVNNAGPEFGGGPLDHWIKTIDATLVGAMRGTLLGIEALRRRGGGAIVNIGSTSALGHGRKHSPWPAYDVAKAGVMRLTTTLGWLGAKENIRVNCLVPAWIASEEVAAYVASVAPAERQARGVPKTLITLDQVAEAVVRLITDESLAGRLLVYWNDEPPRLIAREDAGYSDLEPTERSR
jgi:NAD(P)-dependent dehydrogenase (short-subunit alcohol dehydrogenase family)